MEMSNEQKEIIDTTGNLVLSAGAGAGKTRVLVEKMQHDLSRNTSWKKVAGITFTIKAANEIKQRLNNDDDDIFIGTNNAFVINEIIKPFFREICDTMDGNDFDTDYSRSNAKDNYEQCIEYLKTTKKLCVLRDNKENFIFKLALNILKNSLIARRYISCRYFKLYIDEYQDTDTDMHNLFMYLLNEMNIELFIVGDSKQSIYGWRGAKPELFTQLYNNEKFTHKELNANFRSTQQIQNISNIICETRLDLIQEVINQCQDVTIAQRSAGAETNNYIVEKTKECNAHTCIICRRNDVALEKTSFLNNNNLDFICVPTTPIDEISNNNSWIYFAVCEYCLISKNIHSFINGIPNVFDSTIRGNVYYQSIKNQLALVETAKTNEPEFIIQFKKLGELVDCDVIDETIKLTRETLLDEENKGYKLAFVQNERSNQVMTIHKSKGKEFDVVFVFADDYNLWNAEDKNLFYVATTRAKKKLFIMTTEAKTTKATLHISNIIKNNGLNWHNFFTFDKTKNNSQA